MVLSTRNTRPLTMCFVMLLLHNKCIGNNTGAVLYFIVFINDKVGAIHPVFADTELQS